MMNDVLSYIKTNNKNKREYYIHGGIPVYIKDFFDSENVSIEEFIDEIETRIPRQFLQNVEVVYIGNFPDLVDRNAAYADGAIYITNREPTTHDMLENVIHEIAHSIELEYQSEIYNNNELRNEFLGKRKRLQSILDAEGFKFPEKFYLNIKYSEDFDRFLSDSVGYPTLLSLTIGLFVSPYGATSLMEYFANGFEKYYLGESRLVKEVSPVLYNIITTLSTESD